MGIREDLEREAANFISLRDTLAMLTEPEGVSLRDAALWLTRRMAARWPAVPGWWLLTPAFGAIRDADHDDLGPALLLHALKNGRLTTGQRGATPEDCTGFRADELRAFLADAPVDNESQAAELDRLRADLAATNAELAALKAAPVPAAVEDPDNGIAAMNADRAIAVMAWLLSENRQAMQISGRPNAARIGKAVFDLASNAFREDIHGLTAFHKRVSRAVNAFDRTGTPSAEN